MNPDRDAYITQLKARVAQLEAELAKPKHQRWQAPIPPVTTEPCHRSRDGDQPPSD